MRMKMRSLVAVFLLSSLVAAASAAGKKDRCHAGDKAALLAVKAALSNPYHLASWTNDTTSCCTTSRPSPAPSLAKLTNLSFLTISYTGVSGPVPPFLGSLTNLAQLDLSFNSLTGSLPASLAALPNLYSIDVSRNRLTGSLPPLLFSKAPQVAYLRLSHNNLSGGVPAQFAAVSFAQVDLSRNAFTGDPSTALFGRVFTNEGHGIDYFFWLLNSGQANIPPVSTKMCAIAKAILLY
ncbi:hypothetical protein EJB05_34531, partial [Eragrostis curvula]